MCFGTAKEKLATNKYTNGLMKKHILPNKQWQTINTTANWLK